MNWELVSDNFKKPFNSEDSSFLTASATENSITFYLNLKIRLFYH
jgi:hypothetical protein